MRGRIDDERERDGGEDPNLGTLELIPVLLEIRGDGQHKF